MELHTSDTGRLKKLDGRNPRAGSLLLVMNGVLVVLLLCYIYTCYYTLPESHVGIIICNSLSDPVLAQLFPLIGARVVQYIVSCLGIWGSYC